MASTALDLLLGKIVSALENEVFLLSGLQDDLEELRLELQSMKAFLAEAEKKDPQLEGEKNWVENVRNIAHNVEDIIDEFMYHINKQHISGGCLSKFILQSICFLRDLWETHNISTKLQKIKRTIKAIPEINKRYGMESGISGNNHNWLETYRDSSTFVREDDLVGMENETRLLKRWVIDGGVDQAVISVIGMGGSGKTTLVAKIYNDESVKRQFDCYAWITVSQTYARDDLLRNMIKEFHKATREEVPVDLNTLGYRDMVELLVGYLKIKRYLVVFDDVWDTNLWKQIGVSLPNSSHGSRIVLTTRKGDVASSAFGSNTCTLPIVPLGDSEAWNLFCMKAFSSHPEKTCPIELEPLASELVNKCEGLPLAVSNLGSLMSSKQSITEWRNVCNSLNWQLSNNPALEPVKTILLLSFRDLPIPLKRCFLYCCIFPEDYPIRRKRLIKLWLAEGFVQQENRISMEELADSYLMELVRRCMLQVVRRNEFGRPKACKMHDLLRELSISVSEREKFCAVHDGRGAIGEYKAHRLSVQTIDGDLAVDRGMSQLRTFFAFVLDCESFPDALLNEFKLLRVLDLEDVPLKKLPDGMGILFNLTYLNLRRTRIAELPNCIGRLHNLQSLDIRDTLVKELPRSVANLHNLLHLIMYRSNRGHGKDFQYVYGTRVPFNICRLKKLQATSSVEAEGDIIREIGNMVQLTRIGISNLRKVDEIHLCTSIQKLQKLHYLFLMVCNEEECLGVDNISSPPPQLRILILVGKLERVPHWFSSLQCLTTLYLRWSRLTEDLLPHIAALPNLGKLSLYKAFLGSKLDFSTGFPKLTRLNLSNLPQLTELIIERGVMPNIEGLVISSCVRLNRLPHGIEYLTSLQSMMISSSCKNLIKNVRANFSKVQHIPKIAFLQG